jgi:hypothetical protein
MAMRRTLERARTPAVSPVALDPDSVVCRNPAARGADDVRTATT